MIYMGGGFRKRGAKDMWAQEEEVTEYWRTLHTRNDVLLDLDTSPNTAG